MTPGPGLMPILGGVKRESRKRNKGPSRDMSMGQIPEGPRMAHLVVLYFYGDGRNVKFSKFKQEEELKS